jgi:hypothetical protein
VKSEIEHEAAVLERRLRFLCAASLDETQLRRWREFAGRVPWAHYLQDPAWAEVERHGSGTGARRPFFFWAEFDGAICLTALGVQRRLPIPGRAFWEFKKGPTVLDSGVLDEWLGWLVRALGREAARLHVEPAMPLDAGGDDIETLLERHGFVRRRAMGTWATLLVDIAQDEKGILASFRPATQRSIRKSQRLGIEVSSEDTPEGWSVLSELETELSLRTPVNPVDRETIARISHDWLADSSGGTILIPRHDGVPLAAALIIVHGERAHLPMIPSSHHGHKTLPTSHLVVWEAMRWAKERGCTVFDLEGYSLMAKPGDSLWGVNQFKRGFAPCGQPSKCVAIHEKVFSPAIVASANAVRRFQAWRHQASETQTP